MDIINLLIAGSGGSSSASVDFSSLITAVTNIVSPSDLMAILAQVIAPAGGFILLWFGVRKLSNIFMGAMKSGRLKL